MGWDGMGEGEVYMYMHVKSSVASALSISHGLISMRGFRVQAYLFLIMKWQRVKLHGLDKMLRWDKGGGGVFRYRSSVVSALSTSHGLIIIGGFLSVQAFLFLIVMSLLLENNITWCR